MNDVIAIARTPAEMEQAQNDLVVWAKGKLEAVRVELNEAQESLKIAKQSKWSTTRWQRVVGRARARMIFYTKVKRALEAGYYIVPPFPVDVVACLQSPLDLGVEDPEGTRTDLQNSMMCRCIASNCMV